MKRTAVMIETAPEGRLAIFASSVTRDGCVRGA